MVDKSRVHIIVSGRVQGVFFRDFTRENAIKLGIKGWVRNLLNGDIEIIAEGDKDKLEQLIEAVKIGHGHSRVDVCQIEWKNYTGEFKFFEIVYLV